MTDIDVLMVASATVVFGVIVGALLSVLHARIAKKAAELNAEHKIRGYIARDKDGEVWFYRCKPIRESGCWVCADYKFMHAPLDEMSAEFDVKWEDDPQPAELIIKSLI